ncbi:MAG: dephospho-CoA kinase [Verrucomicrobiae bacterium]|nr:dephospho-CoA kinase [Verrucomicrobiae bacterium]
MLIGLTGGMATGKSKVGDWFAQRGWAVICSDRIVHELYEPGQPLPARIAECFGAGVLTTEGRVDRRRLGEKVFGDEEGLKRLNAMVHPEVQKVWRLRSREALGRGQSVMVVIPLLYEAGVEKEFEQVWVAACSAAEQKRRLLARGLDEKMISTRLAAQWGLQKKIDLASRVVWNDAGWDLTEKQLMLLR